MYSSSASIHATSFKSALSPSPSPSPPPPHLLIILSVLLASLPLHLPVVSTLSSFLHRIHTEHIVSSSSSIYIASFPAPSKQGRVDSCVHSLVDHDVDSCVRRGHQHIDSRVCAGTGAPLLFFYMYFVYTDCSFSKLFDVWFSRLAGPSCLLLGLSRYVLLSHSADSLPNINLHRSVTLCRWSSSRATRSSLSLSRPFDIRFAHFAGLLFCFWVLLGMLLFLVVRISMLMLVYTDPSPFVAGVSRVQTSFRSRALCSSDLCLICPPFLVSVRYSGLQYISCSARES